MSGLKYLLDTNFILGLLSTQPEVMSEVAARNLFISECAFSAITRMEILGFAGLEHEEESLIRQKLSRMTYLPLTRATEDVAISLRQTRKIKLPDAVIAATAISESLTLLTMDKHLQAVIAGAGLTAS
jgi:predicted nucleic acid-binding protein